MRTTVLIVDDHDGFRARARALLEAEGFAVVGEAVDEPTAVAAADRLRPDVAIVDIGLPGADGFSVAARLRSAGTTRRIVLISGRAVEDYGDRVAGSVADGFIGKADLTGERLAQVIA